MNLLVLGANGKIAKIIEKRILSEQKYKGINLTLFLRDSSRLKEFEPNSRVTLIDGDLSDEDAVANAMTNQDIVFIATVDIDPGNIITNNVVKAMKKSDVARVLAANSIGIYSEEPNKQFHEWNQKKLKGVLAPMRKAAEVLKTSGLIYTILRFGWLNDRNEIKYTISKQGEKFAGGSGSRKSMADAVLTIIVEPSLYTNEAIGIANSDTKDAHSAVY